MAELSAAAVEACEGENFESFVGVEYLSSEIYFWSLVPQDSDWEESGYRGDRLLPQHPGGGSLRDTGGCWPLTTGCGHDKAAAYTAASLCPGFRRGSRTLRRGRRW